MPTEEEMGRLARLAGLALRPEEVAYYTKEVSAILHWIERLQEVDVSAVKLHGGSVSMPERADQVTEADRHDEVLVNAPDSQDGWFAVPKMIQSS